MLPSWLRDPRGAPLVLPFTYAAVLIVSEAGLVQNGHVLAGAIIDAVLVLILVNAVQDPASRGARFDAADAAMRSLAVVALSRVIVIGLPLRDASMPLAVLGVALIVAGTTAGIAQVASVPLRVLIVPRVPRLQRRAALAGFVLGLLAYLFGAPRLWASGDPPGRVFLGLLAALVAALVEEVLFRGLLLVSLRRVAARAGVVASCALFAATYLAAGSPGLVLVIAIAGVIFAGVVVRSNSLSGSLAGHALLALGAGGLWPALFGLRHSHLGHSAWIIVLLVLVLVALGRSVVRSAGKTPLDVALPPPPDVVRLVPAPDVETMPEAALEPAVETMPEAVLEPAVETVPEAVLVPAVETVPEDVLAPAVENVPVPEPEPEPAPVSAEVEDDASIDGSLPHGDPEVVLVSMGRLGLSDLLGAAPGREPEICAAVISDLLLSADPRRAFSSDDLDAALRWLGQRKAGIEMQLVARHLQPDTGVPGYDIRVGQGHVHGVLSDSRGLPVAAQRHAGERDDPAALPAAVEALRARFGLDGVIVTCDERATVETDLSRLDQVPGWIVAVGDEGLAVGGIAGETADPEERYAEATAPELRFDPPPADSLTARNGALIAALLATYVAWHLRDAWAELNVPTDRISEPELQALALRLIDQRVAAQRWPEPLASDCIH